MSQVVISKIEYQRLKRQAEAYRKFTGKLFESVIRDPVHDVVKSFRETNLYTDEFLHDLENGLCKSSYAK